MKKIVSVAPVQIHEVSELAGFVKHLRRAVEEFDFLPFPKTEKSEEITVETIRSNILKALDELEATGRIERGPEATPRDRHALITNLQAVIESMAVETDEEGRRVFSGVNITVHTPEPSTPMRMAKSDQVAIAKETGFPTVELRHKVLTQTLRDQENIEIINIFGPEDPEKPRDKDQMAFFKSCVREQTNMTATELKDGSIFRDPKYRGASIFMQETDGLFYEILIRQEQVGSAKQNKSVLSVGILDSGSSQYPESVCELMRLVLERLVLFDM